MKIDFEGARLYVRPGSTDLRKGVTGLLAIIENEMHLDALFQSEMNDCLANLPLHNNKVDYVLSHDGPIIGLKYLPRKCRLSDSEVNTTLSFNDEIDSYLEYKNL